MFLLFHLILPGTVLRYPPSWGTRLFKRALLWRWLSLPCNSSCAPLSLCETFFALGEVVEPIEQLASAR